MKKLDLLTNPPPRIVRVSKAGKARQMALREGQNFRPFLRHNIYAQKYEFIVEFYDAGSGDSYQVTADQPAWELIIADLKRAFGEVPTE